MKRNDLVTFKGNPLTLVGEPLKTGHPIPDVELVDVDLNEKKLSEFFGPTLIVSTVPSLDTSVCSIQTKTFQDRAAELGDDVKIVTISADLPFAQKRFSDDAGTDRIEFLSDHRGLIFAKASGLLIEELHLVARSVSIVDGSGTVRYHQLVNEMTNEPDYDDVLKAVRSGVTA